MTIIIFNIIALCVSFYVVWRIRKMKIGVGTLALIIFDISYVLPIAVEFCLGVPSMGYYGFKLALSDPLTNIIYSCFVIIAQFFFYRIIYKTSLKKETLMDKFLLIFKNFKPNKLIFLIIFLLLLSPLLGWLFSPNPGLYLKEIGTFTMNNMSVTAEEMIYHSKVMKVFNYLGFIGVILLKLIDLNKSKFLSIIRAIFIIIITVLNGKRTLFAFLMLILLAIDVFTTKDKKVIIKKGIITSSIIMLYFVSYSYITGKYYYKTDWYAVINEYFFRSNIAKTAIYSVLNPDQLKILDYLGQSFLYDIFFFIPRSIWPNKPLPYPEYFTSAVHGFTILTNVGWYFQPGCFAEIISNFGLPGIIIGPWFITKLCSIAEASKSIAAGLVGMSFICLIEVFEYSDMFKIVLFIWIGLIIWNYIKKFRFKW